MNHDQAKPFSIFDRPDKPGSRFDDADLDDRLRFTFGRYSPEEEEQILAEIDEIRNADDEDVEGSQTKLERIEELLGYGGGVPHASPLVREKAIAVLPILGKIGGRAARRKRAIMNAQELLIDPEDVVCSAAQDALRLLEAQDEKELQQYILEDLLMKGSWQFREKALKALRLFAKPGDKAAVEAAAHQVTVDHPRQKTRPVQPQDSRTVRGRLWVMEAAISALDVLAAEGGPHRNAIVSLAETVGDERRWPSRESECWERGVTVRTDMLRLLGKMVLQREVPTLLRGRQATRASLRVCAVSGMAAMPREGEVGLQMVATLRMDREKSEQGFRVGVDGGVEWVVGSAELMLRHGLGGVLKMSVREREGGEVVGMGSATVVAREGRERMWVHLQDAGGNAAGRVCVDVLQEVEGVAMSEVEGAEAAGGEVLLGNVVESATECLVQVVGRGGIGGSGEEGARADAMFQAAVLLGGVAKMGKDAHAGGVEWVERLMMGGSRKVREAAARGWVGMFREEVRAKVGSGEAGREGVAWREAREGLLGGDSVPGEAGWLLQKLGVLLRGLKDSGVRLWLWPSLLAVQALVVGTSVERSLVPCVAGCVMPLRQTRLWVALVGVGRRGEGDGGGGQRRGEEGAGEWRACFVAVADREGEETREWRGGRVEALGGRLEVSGGAGVVYARVKESGGKVVQRGEAELGGLEPRVSMPPGARMCGAVVETEVELKPEAADGEVVRVLLLAQGEFAQQAATAAGKHGGGVARALKEEVDEAEWLMALLRLHARRAWSGRDLVAGGRVHSELLASSDGVPRTRSPVGGHVTASGGRPFRFWPERGGLGGAGYFQEVVDARSSRDALASLRKVVARFVPGARAGEAVRAEAWAVDAETREEWARVAMSVVEAAALSAGVVGEGWGLVGDLLAGVEAQGGGGGGKRRLGRGVEARDDVRGEVSEGVKQVMLSHSWAAARVCGLGRWPAWGAGGELLTECRVVEIVVPDQVQSITGALRFGWKTLEHRKHGRCRIRVRDGVYRETLELCEGTELVGEGTVEILGSLLLTAKSQSGSEPMSIVRNVRVVAAAGDCAFQVLGGRWTLEGCSAVCSVAVLERQPRSTMREALSTEYEALLEESIGGIHEEHVLTWVDAFAREADLDTGSAGHGSLRDRALRWLAAYNDDGALTFEKFAALAISLAIDNAMASKQRKSNAEQANMSNRAVWRGSLGGAGVLCSSSHVEMVQCRISGVESDSNHGPELGWGVVVEGASAVLMQDCTVQHALGAGLRMSAGCVVKLECVLFADNTAAIVYADEADPALQRQAASRRHHDAGDLQGSSRHADPGAVFGGTMLQVPSVGLLEIQGSEFKGVLWGSPRRPVLSGSRCTVVNGTDTDICRVPAREVVGWVLDSEGEQVPDVWSTSNQSPLSESTRRQSVASEKSFLCDMILSEYSLPVADSKQDLDPSSDDLWERALQGSSSAITPRPFSKSLPRVFCREIRVLVTGWRVENSLSPISLSLEDSEHSKLHLPEAVCVVSTGGEHASRQLVNLQPLLVEEPASVRVDDGAEVVIQLPDVSVVDAAAMLFRDVQGEAGLAVVKERLIDVVGSGATELVESWRNPASEEDGYTQEECAHFCTSSEAGLQVLQLYMKKRREEVHFIVARKEPTACGHRSGMNVIGEARVPAECGHCSRQWAPLHRPWLFQKDEVFHEVSKAVDDAVSLNPCVTAAFSSPVSATSPVQLLNGMTYVVQQQRWKTVMGEQGAWVWFELCDHFELSHLVLKTWTTHDSPESGVKVCRPKEVEVIFGRGDDAVHKKASLGPDDEEALVRAGARGRDFSVVRIRVLSVHEPEASRGQPHQLSDAEVEDTEEDRGASQVEIGLESVRIYGFPGHHGSLRVEVDLALQEMEVVGEVDSRAMVEGIQAGAEHVMHEGLEVLERLGASERSLPHRTGVSVEQNAANQHIPSPGLELPLETLLEQYRESSVIVKHSLSMFSHQIQDSRQRTQDQEGQVHQQVGRPSFPSLSVPPPPRDLVHVFLDEFVASSSESANTEHDQTQAAQNPVSALQCVIASGPHEWRSTSAPRQHQRVRWGSHFSLPVDTNPVLRVWLVRSEAGQNLAPDVHGAVALLGKYRAESDGMHEVLIPLTDEKEAQALRLTAGDEQRETATLKDSSISAGFVRIMYCLGSSEERRQENRRRGDVVWGRPPTNAPGSKTQSMESVDGKQRILALAVQAMQRHAARLGVVKQALRVAALLMEADSDLERRQLMGSVGGAGLAGTIMQVLTELQCAFGLEILAVGTNPGANKDVPRGDLVRSEDLEILAMTSPGGVGVLNKDRADVVAKRKRGGQADEVLETVSEQHIRPRSGPSTEEDTRRLAAWVNSTFIGGEGDLRFQPWKGWDEEMSTFMRSEQHLSDAAGGEHRVTQSHELHLAVESGLIELGAWHDDPSARVCCVVSASGERFELTSTQTGPRPRWDAVCVVKDWGGELHFELNLERSRREGSLLGSGRINPKELQDGMQLQQQDLAVEVFGPDHQKVGELEVVLSWSAAEHDRPKGERVWTAIEVVAASSEDGWPMRWSVKGGARLGHKLTPSTEVALDLDKVISSGKRASREKWVRTLRGTAEEVVGLRGQAREWDALLKRGGLVDVQEEEVRGEVEQRDGGEHGKMQLQVLSGAAIKDGDLLDLQGERMRVVEGGGQPKLTVLRAQLGTKRKRHPAGTPVIVLVEDGTAMPDTDRKKSKRDLKSEVAGRTIWVTYDRGEQRTAETPSLGQDELKELLGAARVGGAGVQQILRLLKAKGRHVTADQAVQLLALFPSSLPRGALSATYGRRLLGASSSEGVGARQNQSGAVQDGDSAGEGANGELECVWEVWKDGMSVLRRCLEVLEQEVKEARVRDGGRLLVSIDRAVVEGVPGLVGRRGAGCWAWSARTTVLSAAESGSASWEGFELQRTGETLQGAGLQRHWVVVNGVTVGGDELTCDAGGDGERAGVWRSSIGHHNIACRVVVRVGGEEVRCSARGERLRFVSALSGKVEVRVVDALPGSKGAVRGSAVVETRPCESVEGTPVELQSPSSSAGRWARAHVDLAWGFCSAQAAAGGGGESREDLPRAMSPLASQRTELCAQSAAFKHPQVRAAGEDGIASVAWLRREAASESRALGTADLIRLVDDCFFETDGSFGAETGPFLQQKSADVAEMQVPQSEEHQIQILQAGFTLLASFWRSLVEGGVPQSDSRDSNRALRLFLLCGSLGGDSFERHLAVLEHTTRSFLEMCCPDWWTLGGVSGLQSVTGTVMTAWRTVVGEEANADASGRLAALHLLAGAEVFRGASGIEFTVGSGTDLLPPSLALKVSGKSSSGGAERQEGALVLDLAEWTAEEEQRPGWEVGVGRSGWREVGSGVPAASREPARRWRAAARVRVEFGGRAGCRKVVEGVMPVLRHGEWELRQRGIRVLGAASEGVAWAEAALMPVAAMLGDDDWRVRGEAVRVLVARLGSRAWQARRELRRVIRAELSGAGEGRGGGDDAGEVAGFGDESDGGHGSRLSLEWCLREVGKRVGKGAVAGSRAALSRYYGELVRRGMQARWVERAAAAGNGESGGAARGRWDLRACDEGLEGAVLAGLGGIAIGGVGRMGDSAGGGGGGGGGGGSEGVMEDAILGMCAMGERGDVKTRDALGGYVWRVAARDWRGDAAALSLQRGSAVFGDAHRDRQGGGAQAASGRNAVLLIGSQFFGEQRSGEVVRVDAVRLEGSAAATCLGRVSRLYCKLAWGNLVWRSNLLKAEVEVGQGAGTEREEGAGVVAAMQVDEEVGLADTAPGEPRAEGGSTWSDVLVEVWGMGSEGMLLMGSGVLQRGAVAKDGAVKGPEEEEEGESDDEADKEVHVELLDGQGSVSGMCRVTRMGAAAPGSVLEEEKWVGRACAGEGVEIDRVKQRGGAESGWHPGVAAYTLLRGRGGQGPGDGRRWARRRDSAAGERAEVAACEALRRVAVEGDARAAAVGVLCCGHAEDGVRRAGARLAGAMLGRGGGAKIGEIRRGIVAGNEVGRGSGPGDAREELGGREEMVLRVRPRAAGQPPTQGAEVYERVAADSEAEELYRAIVHGGVRKMHAMLMEKEEAHTGKQASEKEAGKRRLLSVDEKPSPMGGGQSEAAAGGGEKVQ